MYFNEVNLFFRSDLGPGSSDGIVGGPRTPQQIAAQKRLQQTQAQVDEVSIFLS